MCFKIMATGKRSKKKYNYYENQTKNAKVQGQVKASEKKVQMCC